MNLINLLLMLRWRVKPPGISLNLSVQGTGHTTYLLALERALIPLARAKKAELFFPRRREGGLVDEEAERAAGNLTIGQSAFFCDIPRQAPGSCSSTEITGQRLNGRRRANTY